jgi:HEAT repeat protein
MSSSRLVSLVEQLSDQSGRVRERARHTLVFIGPPALPLVEGLADSRVKRTRWEAAKTVAAIADPSSMPVLLRLLGDPESDIRWIAAEGLIRLGNRSIPEVLNLLIEEPASVDIRRAVRHVLHHLAADNMVVAETVAPVMEVLGDTDPASAVPPRAEQALQQVEALQGGGA